MRNAFQIVTLCLVGAMAAVPQPGPTQAAPAVQSAAASPAPPQLLSDVPASQQRVSLEATDRPLGDVLADLSASLPVGLCAEPGVADQRVTLHVTGQPVYLVMDRLVRLLSHHPDALGGYHWGPLDHHSGARPVFQLWRDTGSRSEEESERDYPRREMATLLREMRDLAGMSPQERAAYKGDDLCKGLYGLHAKALGGLSDGQLDALLAGQSLTLDPALFADEIAAEYQKQAEAQRKQRENPYLAVIAFGPNAPPMSLKLSVTRAADTDDGRFRTSGPYSLPGTYLISLEGFSDGMLIVDAYDSNANRSPDRLPHPSVPGPAVDLTPFLAAKGVTRAQRGDVGFTLQALARAAHINVYHEDFLRPSVQGEPTDTPDIGLTKLRGTLPDVIAAICVHWNYRCQKVEEDYLFSSRTWAQDRLDDVPERLVSVWRGRIQRQGCLTLSDWGEIAASLSPRQWTLTMPVALPEAGQWNTFNYEELRLIGELSPPQRAAAFSGGGLTLGSLTAEQRQEMAEFFSAKTKNVSEEQVSQAVLTFETDSYAPGTRVIIMEAKLGDRLLYTTRCAIPIPTVPVSTPPPPATGGG